jgi:hypothetical protein
MPENKNKLNLNKKPLLTGGFGIFAKTRQEAETMEDWKKNNPQEVAKEKKLLDTIPDFRLEQANKKRAEIYQSGPKKGQPTGKGALEPSYPEMALLPTSLPLKATSRLGKAALFAAETLNPVSGFKGLKPKTLTSSVDNVNTNLDLEELRRIYHNSERYLQPDEITLLGNRGYGLRENYITSDASIRQITPGTQEYNIYNNINNVNTNNKNEIPVGLPENSKLINKVKELERNITIPILNSKPALKARKIILDKINKNSAVSNSLFTPENLKAFEKTGLMHGPEGTLLSEQVQQLYRNSEIGKGNLRNYLINRYLRNKKTNSNSIQFYSPDRSFSSHVELPSDNNPKGKFSAFAFSNVNPFRAGRTAIELDNLISNIPGKWEFSPGSLSGDSYPLWSKIINNKLNPQFEVVNEGLTNLNTLGSNTKISKLLQKNIENKYSDSVERDEFLKELNEIAEKTANTWNIPKKSLTPKSSYELIPDLKLSKKYKKGGSISKFGIMDKFNEIFKSEYSKGGYNLDKSASKMKDSFKPKFHTVDKNVPKSKSTDFEMYMRNYQKGGRLMPTSDRPIFDLKYAKGGYDLNDPVGSGETQYAPDLEFFTNINAVPSQSGNAVDYGGNIPNQKPTKNNNRQPIIVNDKNDPRLKAYSDSLYLYNETKGNINKLKGLQSTYGDRKAWEIFVGDTLNESLDEYQKRNYNEILKFDKASRNIKPIKTYQKNKYSNIAEEYKKPVQPVIYRKPDYWDIDPAVLLFRQIFKQKFGEEPSRDPKIAKYDYDAAYKAGVRPVLDPNDGLYHWDSKFKHDDYPNRYIDGIDTKTGRKKIDPIKPMGLTEPKPMEFELKKYKTEESKPKGKVVSYTAKNYLDLKGLPSGYINLGDKTGRKEIKKANGGWLDKM